MKYKYLIAFACAFIVSCSNNELCKSNLVTPNGADSLFVGEAEKYISEIPASHFVKDNKDHLYIKFDYYINDSTKNYVEMKFPIIDSVVVDSAYEVSKITLWPFNTRNKGKTLKEKDHGSNIDANDLEWSHKLFRMYNSLSKKYKLTQSDGGEVINFKTNNGRSYIYFKNNINWNKVYCEYNPFKGAYNRHWIIEDEEQYREFKITDKNDPWPIETIITKDSAVIIYKVKATEVIKKPCNLVQAHNYLDEIFKKGNIQVDSTFNGMEYHHGLGTWIRNNWGLWDKNSYIYDFYIEKGYSHPDGMSGDILKTYGITRRMKKEDRKEYYESIGVKECKQSYKY